MTELDQSTAFSSSDRALANLGHDAASWPAAGGTWSAVSDEDVERAASTGVAGPGRELPHLDAVQRCFGEYDVTSVGARVGGAAAEAAATLGAEAYSTSDQVAFASEPDLHTAAHEAAHAIQRRAGAAAPSVAGAGGALTSPADPFEQHADAVADRVVRGESAAPLLAAAPALPAPGAARKVAPAPAGPAAAWAELKTQLDGRITTPGRIPTLVAMLPTDKLAEVRLRMAPIKAACTGRQVLAIAELLRLSAVARLEAGLDAGATPLDLAPHLRSLTDLELLAIGRDTLLLNRLRDALPGSAAVYLPQLGNSEEAFKNGPLTAWFVQSSTPLQVWHAVKGWVDEGIQAAIAAVFDAFALWGWTSGLAPSAIARHEVVALHAYAGLSGRPDVQARLRALANAAAPPWPDLPGDPVKVDRIIEQRRAHGRVAATKLADLLAGAAPLDASTLLGAANRTNFQGAAIGRDAQHRRRVTALLAPDEVAVFSSMCGFDSGARLDWLLATPGVGAVHLAPWIRDWSDEPDATLSDPGRVAALRRAIGATANLAHLVDRSPELQRAVLGAPLLLDWMLGDGNPHELLRFATMDDAAGSVATACRAIAARFDYDWVYQLSWHGPGGDADLRLLAPAIPDRAAGAFIERHLLKLPAAPGPATP